MPQRQSVSAYVKYIIPAVDPHVSESRRAQCQNDYKPFWNMTPTMDVLRPHVSCGLDVSVPSIRPVAITSMMSARIKLPRDAAVTAKKSICMWTYDM